jgi:predicted ATP-grasp superfamily ATP-dependent carboligase
VDNTQTLIQPTVLVVGINQTLVWNVAQSLNRKGVKATVLASQRFAPIRFTGSCKKYITWKVTKLENGDLPASALNQVIEVCTKENITLVMPADFETSLLLAANPTFSFPIMALPSETTLRQLHDKWELSRVLEKVGVPFPNSERIASDQDLLDTQLHFPIITKPLSAWASVGFEVHQSHAELSACVANGQLKSTYPLIAQEFAPGEDVGLSMIAEHGELVAHCMFNANKKRTRTFVEDDRFLNHIKKVLKVTQYHGIGNWDARYDPVKDEYKILELNPRFWSSQLYSTNADINFPYLMAHPELWDVHKPFRAKLGDAFPTLYERIMALATRWVNHANNLMKVS